MSRDQDEINAINLVKGTCALCGATVYADDTGYIEYKGALFCTVSCAEEATGDTIKTGTRNESGRYVCPYCGKALEENEGSSVTEDNGNCVIGCPYCGRESLFEDLKVIVWQTTGLKP